MGLTNAVLAASKYRRVRTLLYNRGAKSDRKRNYFLIVSSLLLGINLMSQNIINACVAHFGK